MARLASGRIATRATAQRRLAASPGLLKNPLAARLAAAVIAADNAKLRAVFVQRRPPVSETLSELSAALVDLVVRTAGLGDPVVLHAVMFSGYNPGSRLAGELARPGEPALGPAVALTHDPIAAWRAEGVGVLGFLLARAQERALLHPLRPGEADTIRRRLNAAAQSPDAVVRSAAMGALGRAGSTSDLPLLRRVAAADPSCAAAPRAINVCVQAWRAIWEIQRREGGQREPRAIAPAQLAAARRSLQGATRSPSAAERRAAVAALGRGGSSADLALLYTLIGEDPDCTAHPRTLNVCILARRSIAEIRRRAAAARRRLPKAQQPRSRREPQTRSPKMTEQTGGISFESAASWPASLKPHGAEYDFGFGKRRQDVANEAHGGADDCGGEAGRDRTEGRGGGPGVRGIEARDLCPEGD